MLWLERQVVTTLVGERDQQRRLDVVAYVDGVLKAMPKHLRTAVVAESLALGAWPALEQVLGRNDAEAMSRHVHGWAVSPLAPVRQYVRLLHSLVLFADNEFEPGAGG
jgi:hypothetical protein